MAGKRAFRLKTTMDISRFLAKVINQLYRSELETDKAGKLGYLGNILIKSMEQSDLEKRVQALEERIDQRGLRAVQ